jgi:hypothetical protein
MTPETKTLHFDLSHGHPNVEYKLRAGLKEYTLSQHTDLTYSLAVQAKPALKAVPRQLMSHFAADIVLPSDMPLLMLVTSPSQIAGSKLDTLMLAAIHVPRDARRKVMNRNHTAGKLRVPAHLKLVDPNSDLPPGDIDSHLDVHDWASAASAAQALTFMHPELTNLDGVAAGTVMDIIEYSSGIDELTQAILQQSKAHLSNPASPNWIVEDAWQDENGQPLKDKPRYTISQKTCDWLRAPVKDAIRTTKNTPELESTTEKPGCWAVHYGITEAVPRKPRSITQTAGAGQYNWTLVNHTPEAGVSKEEPIFDSDKQTLKVSFKNYYLRYLGFYTEFKKADGSTIQQDGKNRTYHGIIDAVNTILAIPLPPEACEFELKVPPEATSVTMYLGGLGRVVGVQDPDDPKRTYYGKFDGEVCWLGCVLTAAFNLMLPTVSLVAGVSMAGLTAAEKMTAVRAAVQSIMLLQFQTIITLLTNMFTRPSMTQIGEQLASIVVQALLQLPGLMEPFAKFLSAELAKEEAAEAILKVEPFFGWAATIIGIAADTASLLETSIEVSQSPAAYQLEAKRTIAATWVLTPDTKHGIWPEKATHYDVTATYGSGATPYKVSGTLPATPSKDPLNIRFDTLPAGDDVKVRFEAKLYAASGWLCGSASTGDVIAKPTDGPTLVLPSMSITENQVPLNNQTTYAYARKLAYNGNTAKHYYATDPNTTPDAAIKNLNTSNVGRNLGRLTSLAYATEQDSAGRVLSEQLSYSFQASGQNLPLLGESTPNSGQMFTMQRVTVSDADPEATLGRMPGGLEAQPVVIANTKDSSNTVGRGFLFIDPRDATYHVRPLVVDASGKFNLTQQSFGRFNGAIDACAIDRSGVAVGVNRQNSKIETLVLAPTPQADAAAPLAVIHSGQGDRAGLVRNPIAVAALPSAGVVILSEGDRSNPNASPPSLQAFDVHGNPAKEFKNKGTAFVDLHSEARSVTYLDVAVEAMGYMYVLKYLGEGDTKLDYVVDLYNPDGTYLTQFTGIAAARLALNYWRDLFALNYEIMAKPGDGGTEPTVSVWLPSTPTA